MPANSLIKPLEFSLASVQAFWPMVMAASLLEAGADLYAHNLKFVEEEIRVHDELRPNLATPNTMRLDLRTMKLRDYGRQGQLPTLVDAPRARALANPPTAVAPGLLDPISVVLLTLQKISLLAMQP